MFRLRHVLCSQNKTEGAGCSVQNTPQAQILLASHLKEKYVSRHFEGQESRRRAPLASVHKEYWSNIFNPYNP